MGEATGRDRSWRRYLGLVAMLCLAGACAGPRVSPDDGAPMGSAPGADPSASRGAAAARIAMRYLGRPYAWGGAGPGGFDCSGLVKHVFAHVGVWIPHNAARQFRHGTPVSRDELEPGDLVFFNGLRHNGIYLGEGRFIHATRPGGVKVSRLDNEWFRRRWVGARRL